MKHLNSNKTKTVFSFFLLFALLTIGYHAIVSFSNKTVLVSSLKNTSELSLRYAYLVDYHSTIESATVTSYINQFKVSNYQNIPYKLGEFRYWLKIDIQNATDEHQNFVLYSDHSMLSEFEVIDASKDTLQILTESPSQSFNLYRNVPLALMPNEQVTLFVKLKSKGAPQIPIFIEKQASYESLVIDSTTLFAIFIAILLIMSIYNLVIYFAVKDSVYLFYVSYLMFTFLALSTTNGYASVIFEPNVVNTLHSIFLLLHYCFILSVLAFTLQFLQYKKDKSPLWSLTVSYSIVISLIAIGSQFLSIDNQARLFFLFQGISYLLILTLIFNKFRSTLVWAKYYYISWIPLIIGGVIQPLVLMGEVQHTVFSSNALLIAVMIEVCFMSFALAERMKRNEFERIKDVTYYASNGLPRKNNIESTLNLLLEKQTKGISVAVVKPENIERVSLYIDDEANIILFKRIYKKLSSLFAFNDAIIPLTNAKDKLCFINNNAFAFLIDEEKLSISLEQLLKSIRDFTKESYIVDGVALPLSAHIGVARHPEHGVHSNQLLNHAQLQTNINANVLQDSINLTTKKISLAAELKEAFNNGQLTITHQPQVDLQTGRIYSNDCKIIWSHPSLGSLDQSLFLPIVEDAGLIAELTYWSIQEQINQQIKIITEVGSDQKTTIKITNTKLFNEELLNKIQALIHSSGIKANNIKLEINTAPIFSLSVNELSIIEKLIANGITLTTNNLDALYSDLAKHNKIPVQQLKIPERLVSDLCNSEHNLTIVSAIVKLANQMAIEVVAEGIKSKEQANQLKALGCSLGQGSFFAKPMSLQHYLDWINQCDNSIFSRDNYEEINLA